MSAPPSNSLWTHVFQRYDQRLLETRALTRAYKHMIILKNIFKPLRDKIALGWEILVRPLPILGLKMQPTSTETLATQTAGSSRCPPSLHILTNPFQDHLNFSPKFPEQPSITALFWGAHESSGEFLYVASSVYSILLLFLVCLFLVALVHVLSFNTGHELHITDVIGFWGQVRNGQRASQRERCSGDWRRDFQQWYLK